MGRKDQDGTFHSTFVRDKGEGRGVRVATVKPQDLQRLDLSSSISPVEAGKGAKARKTKLAVMGLSTDLLDAGDPRYAACIRLANAFRKARTKEMYEYHGHVSSGVSALLASSAMALAAARFLYEVAAGSPEGRADILGKAAKLSDSSRQNELSAWELCSREAVIRKRNDQNSVALPWVTGVSGGEKRKPGRPRKNPVLALPQGDNDAGSIGTIESSGSGSNGEEVRTEEGRSGEDGVHPQPEEGHKDQPEGDG